MMSVTSHVMSVMSHVMSVMSHVIPLVLYLLVSWWTFLAAVLVKRIEMARDAGGQGANCSKHPH